MIVALQRGILNARDGGREMFFVTGEGVLEISDGNVTVLADTASAAEDVVKARTLLASERMINGVQGLSNSLKSSFS